MRTMKQRRSAWFSGMANLPHEGGDSDGTFSALNPHVRVEDIRRQYRSRDRSRGCDLVTGRCAMPKSVSITIAAALQMSLWTAVAAAGALDPNSPGTECLGQVAEPSLPPWAPRTGVRC
jgi:hypothetical protein